MSGVKRAAHLTYKELWAVDGSGVEIVRAIMSQERLFFLLCCLRFDDITTRKERKKLDKLAPIREFVEAFVYNCKKLYTPGPKSEAKSIESESDAFTKIIDNDMVQNIVDCTNAYISNIKEYFSRERDAKLTTVTEILALFGLLIMSGVKRAAHLTYKELWAVEGSGVEIVRAIMSQERFLFLLRCLRFDDITTRKERKKLDKLAPIREFVEAFVYNCKKLYTPGEYNTIDEKLIPFHGRCGFRQYMPNKSAKYGLKFYTISDARAFYTFNFEIYCGKQPDGPYKKSNSPDDIVKRLITPIFGTSRNITDNWYTSYKLSQDLLTEHKLTLVGTLKNKK
ncbi:hypothetical protein LAZ67_21000042 [Cordylochernes scorpioides]|uniref:PiggyBac transposable element-derived protein domain-containing protein n=1 Tax=Cordylochernes scorpioides TaxID=51811 RepID=A0ABY6LMQ7_9ARAC|nr:hypothetical protein LAZ67_21000042 [Cordylochernes scorpioides]